MASFETIAASETDFKSPIDQTLMDKIRHNLDFLNSQIGGGGGVGTLRFVVNQPFVDYEFDDDLKLARGLDGAIVSQIFTPARCRAFLRDNGASGNVKFDLKRWRNRDIEITKIDHQLEVTANSISRIAPAHATQTITKAASDETVNTVSFHETTRNVQSILRLTGGKVRIELDGGAFSSFFVKDQYITISGATDGTNNGTFKIVEIDQDHATATMPNLIISNSASAADQTGAAGTLELQLFRYNTTNPVNAQFVAGENSTFSAFADTNHNGLRELAGVNVGFNGLLAYSQLGGTIGSGGTVQVQRAIYTFSGSPSVTDFIVGETAFSSGHGSAGNNGSFEIVALSGTQLTVINDTYVLLGAPDGGIVDTDRFQIALPTDQSSNINVGETINITSANNAANNQDAIAVKEINRSATNNFVVFNAAMVGEAAGAVIRHTRKIVRFEADQSANFTTGTSIAELENLVLDKTYNDWFTVIEQNRGGGSNWNIVIDNPKGIAIASPLGNVTNEAISLFTTIPTLTVTDKKRSVDADADLVGAALADGDLILLDLLEIPVDDFNNIAGNFSVELS